MNPGRSLFHYLAGRFFRSRFRSFLRANAQKSIFIFDIDNTIAHTYPTLRQSFPSEKHRHLNLEVFARMQQLVSRIAMSPSRSVIFMTARSYKMYAPTLTWLKQNGFPVTAANLIIVPSAAAKVDLLNEATSFCSRIWLIDDMSYNHENGEVKFYEKEIQLLLKMPVKYIGYKTIERFQKKGL